MSKMRSLSAGLLLPGRRGGKDKVDAGVHGLAMKQRQRKLVGAIGLVVLIIVYCIAIGAIYANFLGGASGWVLIVFFAVAGLLWFFPASWTVRWMARPDA
jgi:fatty acid desaturase